MPLKFVGGKSDIGPTESGRGAVMSLGSESQPRLCPSGAGQPLEASDPHL